METTLIGTHSRPDTNDDWEPISLTRSVSTGTSFLTKKGSLAPITAHYSLNGTIKEAFFQLCESDQYSTALAVGMQFCRVALWDIPQHGYYDSPKYKDLKVKSAKSAVQISNLLLMDVLPKIQIYLEHRDKKESGNSSNDSIRNFRRKNGSVTTSALDEKIQEAKLFREVARENMNQIQADLEGNKVAKTDYELKRDSIRRNSLLRTASLERPKTEVVDEDMDGFSYWQDKVCGMLDCVDNTDSRVVGICPPSLSTSFSPLGVVKEEDEKSQNNTTLQKLQQQRHDKSTISSPLSERYQPTFDLTPSKMERVKSAPAVLDKPSSLSIFSEAAQSPKPEPEEVRDEPSSPSVDINNDDLLLPHHDETQIITNALKKSSLAEEYKAQFDSDLERALYLSGLELQRTPKDQNGLMADTQNFTNDEKHKNIQEESRDISITNLSKASKGDFIKMIETGKIKVNFINTFQGRINESTNGCTVIAPLMAIHHLCRTESIKNRNQVLQVMDANDEAYTHPLNDHVQEGTNPTKSRNGADLSSHSQHSYQYLNDTGIKNRVITSVIDIQAPLVLPEVRKHLGLHKSALIIPSDVNDYLIERNFLRQNQFVGVYGGNILDDGHLSSFIHDFASFDDTDPINNNSEIGNMDDNKRKRVAATLYFHEHVICIHRLCGESSIRISSPAEIRDPPNSRTSKPTKKKFLKRFRSKNKQKGIESLPEISTDAKNPLTGEDQFDLIDSLPNAMMLSAVDSRKSGGERWLSKTARIRCTGVSALKSCLLWYAYSKFNEEELNYINSYQFDGKNIDFDPRVFQAFVWSESKP